MFKYGKEFSMRASALIGAVMLAMALAGCGGGKDKVKLSPSQLAPETADLLKALPRGLVGDGENVSHSYETLRGDSGTPQ